MAEEFAPDGVIGAAEAMELLAVSRRTLRTMVARGVIDARRDGSGRLKICRRSVRQWLQNLDPVDTAPAAVAFPGLRPGAE